MSKIAYAGIGSRETPADIIKVMNQIGFLMARNNVVCRTGAALGADQAFANGAAMGGGDIVLALPWYSYEKEWIASLPAHLVEKVILDPVADVDAMQSVRDHHPVYTDPKLIAMGKELKQGAYKLHARNYLILYTSNYVICWTTDGLDSGGTGQGIRFAEAMGNLVFNLGNPHTLDIFLKDIELRRAELPPNLQ